MFLETKYTFKMGDYKEGMEIPHPSYFMMRFLTSCLPRDYVEDSFDKEDLDEDYASPENGDFELSVDWQTAEWSCEPIDGRPGYYIGTIECKQVNINDIPVESLEPFNGSYVTYTDACDFVGMDAKELDFQLTEFVLIDGKGNKWKHPVKDGVIKTIWQEVRPDLL